MTKSKTQNHKGPRTRSPVKRSSTERGVRTSTPRPSKPRTRSPDKPLAPNPSDLERPAPDEPVRIQPPPEVASSRHDVSFDENLERPNVNAAAREAEMERERRRLRQVPERRRATDRAALDANRWVRQRQTQPRANARQTRGHTSMRGR